MASAGAGRLALVLTGALFLTACEEGGSTVSRKEEARTDEAAAPETSAETALIERDVEAPEVFQVTDAGLWDGRPSLGGVWVAHSDVDDPERVIIRNEANGNFVIGALFRRERDNPGPRLPDLLRCGEPPWACWQVLPPKLNVTALRREEVPIAEAPADACRSGATEAIDGTPLDPVAAVAATAIGKAEATIAAYGQPQPLLSPRRS